MIENVRVLMRLPCGVDEIGPANMRIIEDAFMYRLVWALEAIRTRRVSQGWEPEVVAGGGAAALETGVPQFMMSMLIRAGLPSRLAAMAAIKETQPIFATPTEMRAWVLSKEVDALTMQEDWPTPETAELWRRFWESMMDQSGQSWENQKWTRRLEVSDGEDEPPPGIYRIEIDENVPETWLVTPDFRRVARFKKPIQDVSPSLWIGRLEAGRTLVDAVRLGHGKAIWPRAAE